MAGGRDALEADALRAFVVFAEHRNFTTAAAQLRLSQPSLHVKIRKLSASLGVELYQREGRQLTLTTAGERLAAFAQDAQRRVAEFLTELHDNPAPLRLAAGRGALRWVMSSTVQALIRAGRSLQLIPANREAALGALSAGTADLAVIAFDPPPRSVRSRQIAEYPQVLAIGACHPLAGRTELRLADLAGLDLLVPPPGRPHRRTIERSLAEAGVVWHVAAEVDGWDLTVHFAALGLGAAIINGCVGVPARLRAVPIVDLPKLRYWAAWRPSRERALADLLDLL
jgi:DNA-binding transcriptional LysR family regulator